MTLLSETDRSTIIKFFFKRTNLYTWVGRIFAISLITELGAFILPEALTPNYDLLLEEKGYLYSIITAFFIGKYFGGYWIYSLIIKLFVLITCFYFNYKLQKKDKDYLIIKSWNFGINNSTTVNIKHNPKENDQEKDS